MLRAETSVHISHLPCRNLYSSLWRENPEIQILFFFFFDGERQSQVAQVSLKLTTQPRITLNSLSSIIHLPSVEVVSLTTHTHTHACKCLHVDSGCFNLATICYVSLWAGSSMSGNRTTTLETKSRRLVDPALISAHASPEQDTSLFCTSTALSQKFTSPKFLPTLNHYRAWLNNSFFVHRFPKVNLGPW